MLLALVLILCVLAAAVAGSGYLRGRLGRLRDACRDAFARLDEPLKARQDLVPELIAHWAAQGLLQRQVREALHGARQAAGAARAWAATCPDDVRALSRVNDSEAQLARAIQMSLQSVSADRLESAVMRDLIDRLNQADAQVRQQMIEFNRAVDAYNRHVLRTPMAVLARLLGFRPSLPLGKAMMPSSLMQASRVPTAQQAPA